MTAAARVRAGTLGLLLTVLAVHAVGTLTDFAAAIAYPYELDYGEGIVWLQATRIPGPGMYPQSTGLPFIVFHYPPLYHVLARAALLVAPGFLPGGRLVSSAACVLTAAVVFALVVTASGRPARPWPELAVAVAAGLLVLCLNAVHTWGALMRVDMVAVLLSLLGVLVAARAQGRLPGTVLALLLCTAAVFTKQTQLPAGVAVFLIAALRDWRVGLGAAALAGGAGLAALAALQGLTDGGFLLNIVSYNINRYALRYAFWAVWLQRWDLPLMALMLAGGMVLLRSMVPGVLRLDAFGSVVQAARLRVAGEPVLAQALVVLHFALASLMLPLVFKSGSNLNYTLEWLVSGCAVAGLLLVRLFRAGSMRFTAAACLMAATVGLQPWRQLHYVTDPAVLGTRATLLRRIVAADGPVASDDMVLLMQAGKQVVYEPAIATELALMGRWDERPLVDMIRSGGFAFMVTSDDTRGSGARRTAAVDAAMRAAYPVVERIDLHLWIHSPGPKAVVGAAGFEPTTPSPPD